jgi:DNA repair protein RadC
MIREIPPSERPRERLLSRGPESLSLRECLAVILGTGPGREGSLGLAGRVLRASAGGEDGPENEEEAFFSALEGPRRSRIVGERGMGPAQGARILAAFELARRYAVRSERIAASGAASPASSALAARALERVAPEWRCSPREWLGFVPWLRTGRMGELKVVETGVRTHVNVDPAELFAAILALRPKGIFLVHNHPSGALVPSGPDLDLTANVAEMGALFGVRVLGHWIVTSRGAAEIAHAPGRGHLL